VRVSSAWARLPGTPSSLTCWPPAPSPALDYRFAHAAEYPLPSGLHLLGSYHPSLRNTNTGRLERAMFARVFVRARNLQACVEVFFRTQRNQSSPSASNLRQGKTSSFSEGDCMSAKGIWIAFGLGVSAGAAVALLYAPNPV